MTKEPRCPTVELVGPAGKVVVNVGDEGRWLSNGYSLPDGSPTEPVAAVVAWEAPIGTPFMELENDDYAGYYTNEEGAVIGYRRADETDVAVGDVPVLEQPVTGLEG